MTITAPALTETTTDDDRDHITCDYTDDWALCGKDITSLEWLSEGDNPYDNLCEVCADFEPTGFCVHCVMGEAS